MPTDWNNNAFTDDDLAAMAEADAKAEKIGRADECCLIVRPSITCPACGASMPLGKRYPAGQAPMRQTRAARSYGESAERARFRCRCGTTVPVIFECNDF